MANKNGQLIRSVVNDNETLVRGMPLVFNGHVVLSNHMHIPYTYHL